MSALMNHEMGDVFVSFSACTEKGNRRGINEDSFLIADLTTGDVRLAACTYAHTVGRRGILMAVADGIGGAAGGQIASRLAVTSVRETLMSFSNNREIVDQMKLAAEIASRCIYTHAQERPDLMGMGTTLTAALVYGSTAYICQIGDSRAYLIRGQRVKQLTRDQTLAQLLFGNMDIEADRIAHAYQNVLTQALGTGPSVQVAITSAELCQNDHLLVCSDGLSNEVAPEEIKRIVREETDLTAACRRLAGMAVERDGEDDITVILARVRGTALDSSANRTITGSLKYPSEFVA